MTDAEKVAILIKAAKRLIVNVAKVDSNYRISPDSLKMLVEAVMKAEKE